jgi:hypothetical protein
MKLLAATLVFMIAAQPVQAGFCDMEMDSDAAAGPGQHHPEKASDDHGCCDPSDGDDRLPCSERMHCGSCSTGVAAIPIAVVPATAPEWTAPPVMNAGVLAPSHASPPYRPPIVIC